MFFLKKKKFPALLVVFESTLQCTLKCLHCYNGQKPARYPQKPLNTEQTISLLKQTLNQVNAKLFIFTGGEFLLRPDWKELIEAVEQCGVKKINLMTNASLLEEDDVRFLKKHPIHLAEISFPSAQKNIFDKITGAKNFSAFDNAVFATQQLVKEGIGVCHIFVATKLNYKTIQETLDLSYAMGVRHFAFNRFNPAGHGKQHIDLLQLNPEQLKEGLAICENFAVSHPKMKIYSAISIPPCIIDMSQYPHIRPTYCGVGSNHHVVLDAAGNVRMCPFSPTVLGNALQQPLHEIYANEIAKEYISAHPPFCTGCKELYRCKGGCKSSATNCYGSPFEESPFLRAYKTQPIK